MARSPGARFGSIALLSSIVSLVACVLAAPSLASVRRATDIVQLRPGVSLASGRQLVSAAGGQTTDAVPIIHGLAIRVDARGRTALARDARVRAVTSNAPIRPQSSELEPTNGANVQPPADVEPGVGAQVQLPAGANGEPSTGADVQPSPVDQTSQAPAVDTSRLATAYPFSVRAPDAWEKVTGAGVGVAVIDTGIDGDLPDFAGADGASRVIASAVTTPAATTAADTYGHGTHVAGIIAGNGDMRASDDPAQGKYIGIAPGANLVSIKASDDDGNATVLDVIYGLQFAVDHKDEFGIRVVNLSLESTVPGSYRTDPLDAAVESAYFSGILVVAAAGNRGPSAGAGDYAPSNDPFALSVGALDDQGTADRSDDSFTEWSSAGQTQDGFSKPEIGAPGAHIVSTLAPASAFTGLCPSCVVDDAYIRAGGTSMAAPVVSGVAALLLQEHPDWTPDQVKSTLIATGRDVEGGIDEVNAAAALAVAAPSAGANDGVAPNDLVDGTSGAIDYTRSSWSRSSWSTAPDALTAGWTRSSWSCLCAGDDGGSVDPTRSSWSRSSWSTKWSY
jgi:serine protease AprX